MQYLIGVDIGGTKINLCIGTSQGKILVSENLPTQSLQGALKGIPQIFAAIDQLLLKSKIELSSIASIGLSCPGPLSTQEGKLFSPPNLPGWENTPIVSLFERKFQKPVVMNNDANAAAAAEFFFGKFKGASSLCYLTCSTGMGGGFFADQKLLQGASDTAAEVGHFVLDLHGPDCPCGQKGCFEVYCGGASLAKKMQKEIVEKKRQTKMMQKVQNQVSQIDAACLVEAVREKDPYALEVWEEFSLRLAQGVGTVLMCFNPEVLLLGTIAIHAKDLLLDPLKKHLPRFAWKENIEACTMEVSSIQEHLSEWSSLALANQSGSRVRKN